MIYDSIVCGFKRGKIGYLWFIWKFIGELIGVLDKKRVGFEGEGGVFFVGG